MATNALHFVIAKHCSFSPERIDMAYYDLEALSNEGVMITVDHLNIILTACANIKDLARAVATFDGKQIYY